MYLVERIIYLLTVIYQLILSIQLCMYGMIFFQQRCWFLFISPSDQLHGLKCRSCMEQCFHLVYGLLWWGGHRVLRHQSFVEENLVRFYDSIKTFCRHVTTAVDSWSCELGAGISPSLFRTLGLTETKMCWPCVVMVIVRGKFLIDGSVPHPPPCLSHAELKHVQWSGCKLVRTC